MTVSTLRGVLKHLADFMRTRVMDCDLLPGIHLSEEAVGAALGASRNTLRKAFRLLTHERLLVHKPNRGVFVRTPEIADVMDLYAVRFQK